LKKIFILCLILRRNKMDDLLKDAIADAKAVRETALANAKIALEEAFTPKIQSMLSQKIQSEVEEQDEEEIEEQEEEEVEEQSDSSEIGAADNAVNVADGDDEEDPQGPGAVTEQDEEEVEEQEEEEVEEQEEEELEEQEEEEVEEQEEDDELDLEAILRELEEDEEVEEQEEEEVEEQEEEEVEENEEEDALLAAADALAPEAPLDGSDEIEEQEEEEIEEDEEEIEEIDLEEILRELSEEGEEEVEEDTETSQGDVSKLQNELEEHRGVVKYLRSKLNEVNLLNAKLLFTNKLFRSFGLTNEQKLKVVETFDRARNLREVKLVFSTLAESFGPKNVDKPAIKESKGTASKAVASTKPKSKKVITEGSEMKDRFQKLANIL
jgi:hypothetical protein